MALLRDRRFIALALNHLLVDALNGHRVILLTYFCVLLGLSNTTLGTISMVYILVASMTQPLFGFLADRLGVRTVVAGGVLWIGLVFSAAVLLPPWPAIGLLIIASVGSAAFHPAGASHATLMGQNQMTGQETTAASLFFFFGQTGFFLGPIIGGYLMLGNDPSRLFIIGAAAVLTGLNSLWILKPIAGAIKPEKAGAIQVKSISRPSGAGLVALIVAAISQSWIQQNMITFIPKYLSDLGQASAFYGLVAALFMGGSGVGNVLGGITADRLGKKWVVATGMGLSCIPLIIFPLLGITPWLYLVTFAAGFLNGATYSVIVVLAQRLVPGGRGLATGLTLGFIFSAGALGAAISGMVADATSLAVVFYLSAGLAALSSPMGLLLKDAELELIPDVQKVS
jgi:MFS transporter, FSR family, fosmidomycin resistance protein